MNTKIETFPCEYCGCPYPNDHTLDCPTLAEFGMRNPHSYIPFQSNETDNHLSGGDIGRHGSPGVLESTASVQQQAEAMDYAPNDAFSPPAQTLSPRIDGHLSSDVGSRHVARCAEDTSPIPTNAESSGQVQTPPFGSSDPTAQTLSLDKTEATADYIDHFFHHESI